jgi:Immunity protein 52
MWPIGIVGYLKPGWEDADKIAARLRRFFENLAEVDPVFSCWTRAGATRHRSGVPLLITMPTKQAEFRLWVEENPVLGARGGRKAIYGYALRTLTVEENPFGATFRLSFVPEEWWFGHRIDFALFSRASSPSLVADPSNHKRLIALLRRVLLIAATAWDCDWAGVMPGDYRQGGRSPQLIEYQGGWMVYLDAAGATHIDPPQDIAIERLADGAMLLTAATDAMFSGQNPNHMAAALRIQAALAPLNAGNKLQPRQAEE